MNKCLVPFVLVALSACASSGSVDAILAEADLAQLSLTNPQNAEGRVLTGGQPTPDDLATLKELGFGTIISLRLPEEDTGYDQPTAVADLGMTLCQNSGQHWGWPGRNHGHASARCHQSDHRAGAGPLW